MDKQQQADLFLRTVKRVVRDGAAIRIFPIEGDVSCAITLPGDGNAFVGYHNKVTAAVRMAYGAYADYLKAVRGTDSESRALFKAMQSMIDRAVAADSGMEREGFNYKFTGPLTSEWAALYTRERALATEELFFKRYLLYLVDIVSCVESIVYDLRETSFELSVGSGVDEIHVEVSYDKNDPDRFVKCIVAVASVHLGWIGQSMGENGG